MRGPDRATRPRYGAVRRATRGSYEGLVYPVGLILLFAVSMVWLVVVLPPGIGVDEEFRAASMVRASEGSMPIAAEAGAFRDLQDGLLNVGEADPSPHVVVLTRAERSERRAYDGAPPYIPHPLDPEVEQTQDCAPCHTYGGYNPPLRTYTPRSPHPEMSNCLQCHVRPTVSGDFVRSDWVVPALPAYGVGGAIEGAPPAIPHMLQMREHCVSCHGGGSAAPDIRTDHPERFNCRQCHAAIEAPNETFSRPASAGGDR